MSTSVDVPPLGNELNQYVTFSLGPVEYGIQILKVQEFKGYVPLTPIPNMPAYVRGVMNLRGVIIPVFDLRLRFGLEAVVDQLSVIVVAVVDQRTVGLVVDAVSDVIDIMPEDIQDMADPAQASAASHIRGMAKAGDKLIVLLNLESMLGTDSFATLFARARPEHAAAR
jgi:purine-binding chemotaxis protein CheW